MLQCAALASSTEGPEAIFLKNVKSLEVFIKSILWPEFSNKCQKNSELQNNSDWKTRADPVKWILIQLGYLWDRQTDRKMIPQKKVIWPINPIFNEDLETKFEINNYRNRCIGHYHSTDQRIKPKKIHRILLSATHRNQQRYKKV